MERYVNILIKSLTTYSESKLDFKEYQTIVSAIFFTSNGKYLLQLRDDKPGLPLADHWALFGGEVESNESLLDAIKREMYEELNFRSNNYSLFHEAIYWLPKHHKKVVRKLFYLLQIEERDFDAMQLCEGADMNIFTLKEIMQLEKISPWDLSALIMHANEATLFQNFNGN